MRITSNNLLMTVSALFLAAVLIPEVSLARDIEYKNSEVTVNVSPGEPTQVQFPGRISGGFKKKLSAISIERKDDSLIIFSTENLSAAGEAIIVRLDDGRSYSVRIAKTGSGATRDALVSIKDDRGSIIASTDEESPAYREKNFEYAPPTQVSGLMREMVLAAELGKKSISGYKVSEQYTGQVVLDDGTMKASIDRIFIGPNLWGYVLNTENLLDSSQKINPASFRLDGTRAVSATNWELAPRPLNIEQQISGKDKTKVYIITKARKAG